LAVCSSLDKELKTTLAGKSKVEQANLVGKLLGERALKNGITHVAFDRSGYKYHGRIRALADGAREAGLIF
jgi:large subunit ribosomal protein L18